MFTVERRAEVLIRLEVYGGETLAKQLTRSSKHDAIALLPEDHKKVQKLFKEFQRAKGDVKKKAIADEVCTDLTVRSQVEEEVFYREVREAIDAWIGTKRRSSTR
jgi:hypothetical protein